MDYLTMHSTHFIYGYMASDIWQRTIQIAMEETHCRHIGYSYRLAARVLLYASSHRQDNTHHVLCYTNCGALAGMRYCSIDSCDSPLHHRLLLPISSNGSFICIIPQTGYIPQPLLHQSWSIGWNEK